MRNYKGIKLIGYSLLMITLGFGLAALLSFKSPSLNLPQSSNKITNVGGANVYKLNVEGQQYIVVICGSAIAITKHN